MSNVLNPANKGFHELAAAYSSNLILIPPPIHSYSANSLCTCFCNVPFLQDMSPSHLDDKLLQNFRTYLRHQHLQKSWIRYLWTLSEHLPHQKTQLPVTPACLLSLLSCDFFESRDPVLVNFKLLVCMVWFILYNDCHIENLDKHLMSY